MSQFPPWNDTITPTHVQHQDLRPDSNAPAMTNRIYCPPNKDTRFFRLLRLARISRPTDVPTFQDEELQLLKNDLDSLPGNACPAATKLLPLMYRQAAQTGLLATLHPETQSYLKRTTLQFLAIELANEQWLLQHLAKFEKNGISVILLKGAAFNKSIYPENAPRMSSDLDLLVQEEHFDAACSLLADTMQPVLLDSKRATTHETLFERVFTPKQGSRPIVEIHRGLTNPFVFTIHKQCLLDESTPHPAFDSKFVRMLSPEDTLLHLAVHAFRDLDFCTHNLLDAHEVWCQCKPESEKLLANAKKWGARKVLYYLLANCKAVLETPVPHDLYMQLQPNGISDRINTKILQAKTLRTGSHPSMSYRLLQLLSQTTLPDSLSQGLKYQLCYAATRMRDLVTRH